ncbi:MAG: arginine--tRNA ligase [Cryomorphaceae bacterium]|nr:arginine--tRNA ligase [Cryomorphaceae bacterium]
MEYLKSELTNTAVHAIENLFGFRPEKLDWQLTRKEFSGDLTLVVFPFTRYSKLSPEETGQAIGEVMEQNNAWVDGYNVVKGFLNLEISPKFWVKSLADMAKSNQLVRPVSNPTGVMVEYSSPNTNKPLHLGHIRNCLLGWSVGNLQKAIGNNVYRVQIINDRGIHICKSMVAWKLFAGGETPENTGLKGDHLVGKYYVVFDQKYREEIRELIDKGVDETEAKDTAPIMVAAREMLRKWEEGDAEVMKLWETMNGWVYQGFDATYDAMGVSFDKNYYESNTYKLGKSLVEKGLQKGVFYREADSSVWIDLSDVGLDKKILLRSDGTSVYMTQDVGTAVQRFEDFDIQRLIYTVGNEQDYHFQVLFEILKKLGYSWAEGLYHLSYGMVDLPTGKMKSREGTVVDADDLIREMKETAAAVSAELGKTEGLATAEKEDINRIIGLGALKYFILKVDPRKRMTFNPEDSIDMQGNTGPFLQYTHARIKSLLRKAETSPGISENISPEKEEIEVVKTLLRFSDVVHQAAEDNSPALVANFIYDLVKTYNGFYQNHSILRNENPEITAWRLSLSEQTARVINFGLDLLGIESPERM